MCNCSLPQQKLYRVYVEDAELNVNILVSAVNPRETEFLPLVTKLACYQSAPGCHGYRVRKYAFSPSCPRLYLVTCETMNFIYRSRDAYQKKKRKKSKLWVRPSWQPVLKCPWNSQFHFENHLSPTISACSFLAELKMHILWCISMYMYIRFLFLLLSCRPKVLWHSCIFLRRLN